MSNSKTASFPVLAILGLIFVTLKLAGIGAVLSPFWIPLAIVLGIFLVAGVLVGLGKIFK